jgi:thioredoxin 1
MSMAGSIIEVTDDSFQAEVIESESPILVDFWAPWCAPCRAIAPLLEEIAAEREDLRIVKLNVDENQEIAASFQILSIPTLILFKNGAESKRLQPSRTKSQIEAQLELAPAA